MREGQGLVSAAQVTLSLGTPQNHLFTFTFSLLLLQKLMASHSTVERLKQKFESPRGGMGGGGSQRQGGGTTEASQYYEDDVRFWRERALRLGELARPLGVTGSLSAADQFAAASAQAPSPSGRGHHARNAAKTATNGGYDDLGGGGPVDWDMDGDFSADAGGSPYVVAAAAEDRHRRGAGGGGGGANNKNDSRDILDHLLKQRPSPPSNQDPGRLRQHVELHETVAALHGIAADLVERSNGIEARLSVRPLASSPCFV